MRGILWIAGAALFGVVLVLAVLLRGESPPLRSAPFGSEVLAYVCAPRICVWNGKNGTLDKVAGIASGRDSDPVWSPDGSRLAFIHNRAGAGFPPRRDLYVASADGSGRTHVVSDVGYTSRGPAFAWAPDGRRLAVTLDPTRGHLPPNRDVSSTGARGDLYVVDATGSHRRRLTRSRSFDGFPAWLGPRSIAFVRMRPGREFPPTRGTPSELRVLDTVSRRERLLLRRPAAILNFVASPDRRSAALVEDGVRVLVVDLHSGEVTATLGGMSVSGVGWSPDGRRLVLDGGAIASATTGELLRAGTVDGCQDPDWSPDGNWLVCSVGYGEEDEQRRGGSDLQLARPGTRSRLPLTDSASASGARWRPRAAP